MALYKVKIKKGSQEHILNINASSEEEAKEKAKEKHPDFDVIYVRS